MSVRTQLTNEIPEEGSIGITASFTDEDGASMIPDSIIWTLTDRDGAVINSRSAVTVTPAASVTIVLSGDDLAIGDYGSLRALLIEYVYTSSLGSSLPDKHEVTFSISDLVAVP
jgi:hypothetical protein